MTRSHTFESAEELTPERVEEILTQLNTEGFMSKMRATVNASGSFFDPDRGYITENDESTTGSVLTLFRELLTDGDSLAHKGLDQHALRVMVDALVPESDSRKVLLGYWGTAEDAPWWRTERAIADRQGYNNSNFPSVQDIERIMQLLYPEK